MDKIEIREFQGQDDEAIEMAFYAFYPTPGDVEKIKKMAPYFKEDTSFVLYENEKPVAALICKPIPQNVRGSLKTMCGIQNVATKPEARRKGYSKKLMKKAFTHLKEKDYAFSTLYPFKESYYEKFGYISFPQIRTAIFNPKQLVPLLKKELDGKVERYSFKDGYELYEKFIKEIQNITHGMGIKHSTEQIRLKDNSPEWVAIAESNGEIHGLMTYRITGFWKEIKVRDFFYKDSLGKYLLLQYIAIHADQVKEAQITIKAGEYPETWINDTLWGENGKIASREWVPSCMGRVVQVEKLSGIQVGEGKFSAKITDDHCDWNNKIYSFEAKESILEVTETEDFDCELTIQGLSSIIYGCYNLDDFDIKNWGKIPKEIKNKIRVLFPKMDPFLYADF